MKLVILDRDGVINQDSDQYIKTREEYLPIPGSIGAIARLGANGCAVAVATNQSGVARGLLTAQELEAIHEKLRQLVIEAGGEIGKIVFCPHGPGEGCDCRKPKPGLMEKIIGDLGAPRVCFMVGDNLRDLQAGMGVGALPVLVRTGKGERTITDGGLPEGTRIFDDLAAAADWIIAYDPDTGAGASPSPDA
uniref:D-glycero-beta-D-manno-heptose-1,7-bisphosphate 7-phosphatase n=1 Tax=Candidatus Kentrum sp. DK TaxID=2126562 RepID=A0A450SXF8_9GAMM|nr:MAG: D-alpha,beta-D-heptose 1,7-bisphosphate phosphatase [Candidatus Kentron sp. DK]